jgi:hypothetical protein
MRARVTSTTLRRVERIEQARVAARYIGAWPEILSVDEWEALATPSQAALCEATSDYQEGPAREEPEAQATVPRKSNGASGRPVTPAGPHPHSNPPPWRV